MWKKTLLKIGIGRPELHKGNLRREHFELTKAFHHGVPANATSLAYDVVQKIVAIGTVDGHIKIIGKPGIELVLDNEHRSPIRFLHFVTNTGHLVSILDNSVEVWDLESREVIGSKTIAETITAFHMYPGSKYLFVGTEEGSVRVIDIEAFNLSTYKITSKAVRSDVSAKNRSPVRWLGVAPDSDGSIMIAYADGLIVLWGLKQKKVLRHYELLNQPLESCAWHPEGKFFITGYEDGELCLWKQKAKKPLERFYVSSSKAKRTPIKQIVWTKCAGEDMIIVRGGTPDQDPGLTILQGMGPPNPYRIAHIPCRGGDVSQFVLNYASPWEGADPVSLLMLTESSHLQSNVLSRSLGFPIVTLPPSSVFQDSRITAAHLYPDVSKLLFHDLFEVGNIRFDPSYWLATGGKFAEDLVTGRDLLVTCHDSGKVRFWDASSVAIRLLLSFYVGDEHSSPEERQRKSSTSGEVRSVPQLITILKFCPASRILVLSCLNGSIYLYKFTSKECKYQRLVYRPPSKAKPPSSVPPSEQPAARLKTSSQLAPHHTAPSSDRASATEPAAVASSPSKKASGGTPAPTQPPAPLPPSEVQQTAQPASPTLVKSTQSQVATPTKKSSGGPVPPQASSSSVSTRAPPSESHTSSGPSTTEIVRRKASPGFYLALECVFDTVIKSLALLPKYNLLAIGDQNGYLTIIDTRTASRVLGAAVAQHPEPITNLTWAESVGNEPDEAGNVRKVKELVLLVGVESGFVTVVIFRGSRIFFNPHPFEKKQPSPITGLFVVDARGKPYRIRAPKWKEVEEEKKKKKEKKKSKSKDNATQEQTDTVKEKDDEWVVVDEKQSNEGSPSNESEPGEHVELRADNNWAGAQKETALEDSNSDDEEDEDDPNKMGQRFLLMCAESSLCIYTVPDYDQLARIETKHPVLSSHIVSHHGEYCLVCFNANSSISVYSLMDLTLLMETTLDRLSLNINSSLLRQACVLEDGRMLLASLSSELIRLSLIKGENSLNLPYSLPTAHIRGIVLPERPKGLLKSLFGSFDLSIFAEVDNTQPKRREPPSERLVERGHSRERDMEHEARQQLFEGRDVKAREKYERGGEGNERVREARKGVAGVKDQMNRNIQLLGERGEKLGELAEKTAEMEEASSEFYQNARKLADKYKNKKWYEF